MNDFKKELIENSVKEVKKMSAFPVPEGVPYHFGIDTRTYIATATLAGMLGDNTTTGDATEMAEVAVTMADALIEELLK